eukprot:1959688-Rhodomonas_salina.2
MWACGCQGELRRKVKKRREAMKASQAGSTLRAEESTRAAASFSSERSSNMGSVKRELQWEHRSKWEWVQVQAERVTTELFFPGWKHTQLLAEEAGVSFQEVVMTSFYWNCPPMVPNKLKQVTAAPSLSLSRRSRPALQGPRVLCCVCGVTAGMHAGRCVEG